MMLKSAIDIETCADIAAARVVWSQDTAQPHHFSLINPFVMKAFCDERFRPTHPRGRWRKCTICSGRSRRSARARSSYLLSAR